MSINSVIISTRFELYFIVRFCAERYEVGLGFRLVQRSVTFSDAEGQRPAISATAELLFGIPHKPLGVWA